MTNISGPDVSFYQDSPTTVRQIDFRQMASAGAKFVIIRAGQNLWTDSDLDYNLREAKAAGLPRGSYWYYDSRIEPQLQARLYISSLKGDLGELPLFADFEDRYGGKYGGWRNWYAFLEELKRLANGHEIGIYTGYYYWRENTGILQGCLPSNLAYFHQFPLWVANYGVSAPSVPKPWAASEWMFWQYTDNGDGPLFGVESLNIDMNYFNGDEAKFKSRFNLGTVPPPPPPPPVSFTLTIDGFKPYKGTL